LSADELEEVTTWRHFALRCRDLFSDGEDTSWYEIGDENGSVTVSATVPVRPEPVAGSLFARVVHATDIVTVGVLDLTGSEHGRWSEPTAHGSVSDVTVRVLVDRPDEWSSSSAVLGAGNDHFVSVPTVVVAHRQGRALEVSLPLVKGWSVLRLRREGHHDA
jgi:hypothetical protein